MNKKCKSFLFFSFFVISFGILLVPILGSSEDEFPLQSRITNVSWTISPREWYPYDGESFGNHTLISFQIEAKIINKGESNVISQYGLKFQYDGETLPEHITWGGDDGAINMVFEPGINERGFSKDFLFNNSILNEPIPGKYSFWISDFNQTTISYKIKTLTFYQSDFVNFIVHDYEYILIGIGIIALLGVFTWFSVKKIQVLRLKPILTKRLGEIKMELDRAEFNEVNLRLEESLPEIEILNDVTLNQKWNDLKKRCLINIRFREHLQNIISETDEDFLVTVKQKLLNLLKEIHSPYNNSLLDPIIESEVITALKEMD